MRDSLTQRLNQILPKLTSDDFLSTRGIGNEIAFYIFDYAPENELRIREHIRFLLDHLPKNRPGLRVTHVNLFDFLIHYLKERNLLERSFRLQREKGNDALLKALKGVLHEEKIAQRFAGTAKSGGARPRVDIRDRQCVSITAIAYLAQQSARHHGTDAPGHVLSRQI